MTYKALVFCLSVCIAAPAYAGDTLMDILYKDQRQNHLETLESQRIQYEERGVAYLEGLYSAAYDMMSDPALADLSYTPHLDDVKIPPKPDDAKLAIDTTNTKPIETKAGTKFLSGGPLDMPRPAP